MGSLSSNSNSQIHQLKCTDARFGVTNNQVNENENKTPDQKNLTPRLPKRQPAVNLRTVPPSQQSSRYWSEVLENQSSVVGLGV